MLRVLQSALNALHNQPIAAQCRQQLHLDLVVKRNFGCLTRACDAQSEHRRRPGQHIGMPQTLQRRPASTAAGSPFFFGVWQKISNSTMVAYTQQLLIDIHDYTGLPWWASIIVSTILFRTIVTLPLAIYQYKVTARIERISLEMPAIVAQLKKEANIAMKKFNWTEQQTRLVYNRSLKKQWNKLIVRDNCHPAKTFIVLWAQIPLWICQSMALRNMVYMLPDPSTIQAQITITEMTVGGFGWIPNLTEVDASYILPVTLGLLNLCIIELQFMLRSRTPTRFQRITTNVFRGLSLLMIPVACSVPSALTVYWVASSAYGLAQNILLASPPVRRALGIPHTPSELHNPYERIWQTIKIRTGQMEQCKEPGDNEEDKRKTKTDTETETEVKKREK